MYCNEVLYLNGVESCVGAISYKKGCHLQGHIKIDCVMKVSSFVININVVINHYVAKVVSTAYYMKMT